VTAALWLLHAFLSLLLDLGCDRIHDGEGIEEPGRLIE
jgi:hypothetical protein